MIRLVLAIAFALLAGCAAEPPPAPLPPPAPVSAPSPPLSVEERAAKLAVLALLASETEGDAYRHCQRAPDPVDNTWMRGSAVARCGLLAPPAMTLEQVDAKLAGAAGAAAIDARFAALVAVAAEDPARDTALLRAYSVFDASPAAEGSARRWHELAPASAFANAALGLQRARAAIAARGTGAASELAEAQRESMRASADEAAPLLVAAMTAEPRLTPVCAMAMRLRRYGGSDELAELGLATCEQHGAVSFAAFDALTLLADPRWGGSEAQQAGVAGQARAAAARNPVLGALVGPVEGREVEMLSRSLADGGVMTAEQVAYAVAAARVAPDPDLLANAGNVLAAGGDRWQGLLLLSQAVRFAPDSAWIRKARAQHFPDELADARAADLAVAAQLDGE